MLESGLKPAQVAKLAGIHLSTVYRIKTQFLPDVEKGH